MKKALLNCFILAATQAKTQTISTVIGNPQTVIQLNMGKQRNEDKKTRIIKERNLFRNQNFFFICLFILLLTANFKL
ncbi:MAG: hypothetical protein ACYDCN_11650 [Bacteroidia bacterium]